MQIDFFFSGERLGDPVDTVFLAVFVGHQARKERERERERLGSGGTKGRSTFSCYTRHYTAFQILQVLSLLPVMMWSPS